MKNEKVAYFWRGRDIETLTRDELLIATKKAMHDLKDECKRHMTDLDMMTVFDRGMHEK